VDGQQAERLINGHLAIVAAPVDAHVDRRCQTGRVTDLDARYGRRPPLSPRVRLGLVIVGILLLVGVAAAVTALYVAGRPKASLEIEGYSVVSAQQVKADVNVTKPSGRSATCTVRVLDEDLDLVGSLSVEAKGAAKHVHLDVTVPTTTAAYSVQAGDCVLS
jgi:hypothetical protein